jgi:hypothetical protein
MIVHGDLEGELYHVWNLISELSEQLDENRIATVELRAQADALKVFYNTTSTHVSLLTHVTFRPQLCIRVPVTL